VSDRIRLFFADPARQALAWAGLGILGLALAAVGLWLYTNGAGSRQPVRAHVTSNDTPRSTVSGSQVSGATLAPSVSPAVSASPTETASPTPSTTTTPTPTQKPATQREQTSGGGATAAPTDPPAPAAAATQAPAAAAAGGLFCSTISATSPPNTVIGIFTIGGSPAPAGTSVSLAFDGVVGPTAQTTAAGGYRVDYGAGGGDCANRVGAAISVVVNSRFYSTGHTVGDSPGAPVNQPVDAP
jgi:hypothetical protein